ncbi:glycoside hydrolase family 3 protein, partial [Pseudomonas sp. BGM005]|nr:glycoside hydrolase family 3 protein [Pseudomonas sp. BG5]
ISESRIDESARRILREKFRLGAFENRRVDVREAANICGSFEFTAKGVEAQRRSLVLLAEGATLTLGARVFLDGVDAA